MDWHNYPDQFVSSPDPRLSAGDEGPTERSRK